MKDFKEHISEWFEMCVPFETFNHIINYVYDENLYRLKKLNKLYLKDVKYTQNDFNLLTDESKILFQLNKKLGVFYVDCDILDKYNVAYSEFKQHMETFVDEKFDEKYLPLDTNTYLKRTLNNIITTKNETNNSITT